MMKTTAAILLLFQLVCCFSQSTANQSGDPGLLEEQLLDTQYVADRGYALWYDADRMAPAHGDYAYDVFLPMDGEAAGGVSLSVYEIGYDNLIPLPQTQGQETYVLDLYDPDGLFSAGEAFPMLMDALAQAGYLCVTQEDLPADDFGSAYALFEKDGAYVALHITELASGTFLMVLTYPQGEKDTWGVWLEEIADTFSATPGV
jgi:hypothetical protein